MNFRIIKSRRARNKMKRRIKQLATFDVHCGKHIQKREHSLYLTRAMIMYVPNV